MNDALASNVRDRAHGRCEYCRLFQERSTISFEIDHVIARKHGGTTCEDNLAFSCFYCNSAKGPNIAGIDPETGEIVGLFHPRRDLWEDHFRWDGPILQGITPNGRATIAVLEINHPKRVAHRRLLVISGLFSTEENSP